jgi:predicted kinase
LRLAEAANFHVIRSDVVRKELAGIAESTSAADSIEGGIYTPEWSDRTYAECLARAETLLFAGQRVLIDATFIEDHRRQPFLEAARRWGVPVCLFFCTAAPEVVRERLAARTGDVSDADWSVYQHAARQWQEPDKSTGHCSHLIDTSSSTEAAATRTLELLRELELA